MDAALSLAFTLHSNRGVYALLLGSGISRAAAIPTGWEVVLDLTRKVARALGEEASCDLDPATWFAEKFGEPPTYNDLLARLCKTPAERQQLLRSYFEPSDGDESADLRRPTKAHRAIAAMVKSGHIRVVVTTNFDRLLERALEELGISPTVISTADAVEGAVPLTHATCTVIKLHGDYLDARIRNTVEELAKYPRPMTRLLDRVLDEFGLLVCGWSAEWDPALRDALMRCKSRRFTTYWTLRGAPSDEAVRLIEHRRGERILVEGADEFFADIHEKVVSLASFDRPHPLSVKTAVATMKRFLADERHRIELHDLLMEEVKRALIATSDEKMPLSGTDQIEPESVRRRLMKYEAAVSTTQALLIAGCYWGGPNHEVLWASVLERMANKTQTGGYTSLINLRRYPALLLFYSGGLAAVAAMNSTALRALFLLPRLRDDRTAVPEGPPVAILHPQALMSTDEVNAVLSNAQREFTPLNNYLFKILREPLRDILPTDEEYDRAFDKFEYLQALVAAGRGGWVPIGRFGWKGRRTGEGAEILTEIEREVAAAGNEWAPIRAGLLESVDSFKKAADLVATQAGRMGWY